MAAIYFHFYNICGLTSSVTCMAGEIVESIMKNNATYREQKVSYSDVNMTTFMDEESDILIFRVVAEDPYHLESTHSRFNYKAHYLSPSGNVKQTRGSSAHEERVLSEQQAKL